MDIDAVLKDYALVTEFYHLHETFELVIGDASYRIEILSSHKNANAPWTARGYSEHDARWEPIEGFPEVLESDRETAVRLALSFLIERSN